MRTLLVLSLAAGLLAASAGCQSCRTLWGSAAAPVGPPVVAPGPVPATTYSVGGPAGNIPPSLPVVTQPAAVAPAPYAGGAPAPLPMLSGPQNYTPITGR